MERTYHSPFRCPDCGHKNTYPRVGRTAGGTEIVLCDGCGLAMSRRLIANAQDEHERRRRRMINEWAGWGVDVV